MGLLGVVTLVQLHEVTLLMITSGAVPVLVKANVHLTSLLL
jgi:hypothetical protein